MKLCDQDDCNKPAKFGAAGAKKPTFCPEHKKDGMVDLGGQLCVHPGCTFIASFGVAGTKTREFCSGHKKDGMVDVQFTMPSVLCSEQNSLFVVPGAP